MVRICCQVLLVGRFLQALRFSFVWLSFPRCNGQCEMPMLGVVYYKIRKILDELCEERFDSDATSYICAGHATVRTLA